MLFITVAVETVVLMERRKYNSYLVKTLLSLKSLLK